MNDDISAQIDDEIPDFYKVEKRSGLIIFPRTDSIPQDVIFLPVRDISNINFDSLIATGLKENNNKAIFIYFQGLRHRNPNLASYLKQCYQATGNLKIQRTFFGDISEVQIVLGTIIFNKTSKGEIYPDPDMDNVELKYNNQVYRFTVYESMTGIDGAPIVFKKIEVN